MKNLFIATLLAHLALVMAPSISDADIIKCTFTEPFVSTIYSMATSTLTYSEGFEKPRVVKRVSFQINSAGVFELVAHDGQVLQTLTLNNAGSDGMSEIVYPFEVKDPSVGGKNTVGGCVSNRLKK